MMTRKHLTAPQQNPGSGMESRASINIRLRACLVCGALLLLGGWLLLGVKVERAK